MKYYTTENKLTEDVNYNARVLVDKTYNEDELIDKMLLKRNIISKPDLRGVISAMKETIVEIVKEGNGLNLPWIKLGFSMKGNFATAETVRDPELHTLEINAKVGALLTDLLTDIRPERIIAPEFAPRIVSFIDAVSGKTNSIATPGGTFKITGDRLRIGGIRSGDVGIYLRAKDNTETKVEVIMDNDPRVINGQLPSTLTTGNYKLVVKTQLGVNSQLLSEVRTGTGKFTLTVE